MLALRYYGQRDIRLEEVPTPEPKEGEVLIKVTHAGFSQTQVNEFIAGPFIINKSPHPLTGKAIPLIPCQEFGGIVEEVGYGVDKEILGKQVSVLPLVSCGKCEFCRKGEENLCDKLAYHGLLGLDGGFAEYCVVKRENIFPVEEKSLLTFVEPLLIGFHSLNRYRKLESSEGKKVLVMGAGAVGISVATVWKLEGKSQVFMSEILPNRKRKAEEFGFELLSEEELKKQSFDVVIDAAGMDPLLGERQAFIEGQNYVRKGGVFLDVGTYFHFVSIVPASLLLREINLITSITYNSCDVEQLKNFLETNTLSFEALIEEIPLSRIVEDGYYRAEVDKDSFVRLVVRC